jgi:hypothetical protein
MPALRFRLALVAPALLSLAATEVQAQAVVEGASKKVTIACGPSGVRVSGLSNQVTLTGTCTNVIVEGKANTVHVATLGRLTLAGSGNRVYWKDGIDGRMPQIDRSAGDNVVERRGGTTELAPAAAAPATGASSGVSITAERDKATVAAGAVVVDAEKKVAPATGTSATRPAPRAPSTREPAPAVPAPSAPAPAVAATAPSAPAPASAAPATTPAKAPEALVFADNREERTVDCRGRVVEVIGNRNRLTLRGSCAALSVSGNDNQVNVESTPIIATSGNLNTVRYRALVDEKPPRVSNTGKDNSIRRAEP